MADFVSEHAREFIFCVEIGEQAAVDINIPTGCGVGVNGGVIDDRKGERGIGHIAYRDQALTNTRDVSLNLWVIVECALLAQLLVHLKTDVVEGARGGQHDVGTTSCGINGA